MRQGLNDYTEAFKDDPNNEGHHARTPTVLAPRGTMNAYIATSLPSTQWISLLLPLKGNFNGRDVKEAMKGHILASASTVGTYTLNPKLIKNS